MTKIRILHKTMIRLLTTKAFPLPFLITYIKGKNIDIYVTNKNFDHYYT